MKARGSVFVASLFAALVVLVAANLKAQSEEKGFTFNEEYRGSSTPLGQTTVLDSALGYNFNKYFGAEVGLPVYFSHVAPDTRTNRPGWNDNFGDAYVGLRFNVPNPWLNYTSMVTGGAPTGSFARGFSTGRATVAWDNHLDHRFGRFTPFLDAGLGNSIWDLHSFIQPYRTLGFVSEYEGGIDYKVWGFVQVGGSAYDVLPGGQQKLYSQFFQRAASAFPPAGNSNHGRVFESAFETTGPASIARDNGYSGWVDLSPLRSMNFEVGYNRSVRYALDTVSFRIGVNPGSFVKRALRRF